MVRKNNFIHRFYGVVLLFCFNASVLAEVRWSPYTYLETAYSDNIDRDFVGATSSSWVTSYGIGFNLIQETQSSRSHLGYQWRQNFFSNASRTDEVQQNLNASSHFVLLPERLFVDASSNFFQDTQQSGQFNPDQLTSNDLTRDTWTYRIAPRLKQRLGTYALSEFILASDKVASEDDQLDSDGRTVIARVNNNTGQWRWPWLGEYKTYQITFDDAEENRFNHLLFRLGYLLSSQFQVYSTLGQEDNRFASKQLKNDGAFWNVGLHWLLSPLSSLNTNIGHKFFGSTVFFDFRIRTRLTRTIVSYKEDLSTQRDISLSGNFLSNRFNQNDAELDEVSLDFDNDLYTTINFGVNTDNRDVFVYKTFAITSQYLFNKGFMGVEIYATKRTFQFDDFSEKDSGLVLTYLHQLSVFSHFTLQSHWREFQKSQSSSDIKQYIISADITRQFSEHIKSTVNYQYFKQTSNPLGFDENRISVQLNARF